MFMSQDDMSYSPKESSYELPHKKPKSNFSHLFDDSMKSSGRLFEASQPDNVVNREEEHSRGSHDFNMFKLSQESSSMGSSQFSQDFTDRLGLLNVKNTQDALMASGFNSNSNSSLLAPGEEICFDTQLSWDAPSTIKPPRTVTKPSRTQSKVKSTIQSQSSSGNNNSNYNTRKNSKPTLETEQLIELAPSVSNVFSSVVDNHKESYINNILNATAPVTVNGFSQPGRRIQQPSKIWISAFKERSKYLTEFEEIALLGEGTFSTVTINRHRVDGSLYAIKKMKSNITNNKIGKLQLKEVHALSTLQGGPNILQYNSAWIDNHNLYIQTELCQLGSLEDLITTQPSLFSVMNIANHSMLSNTSSSNKRKIASRNRSTSFNIMLNGGDSNSNFGRCDTDPEMKYEGINEELAWFIMEQISTTLQFIHSKGLAHLDLRPANIFITSNNCYSGTEVPTMAPITSHGEVHTVLQTLLSDNLLCGRYIMKVGDFGHCVVDNRYNKSGTPYEGLIEGETRYCARELINTSDAEQCNLDLSKADIFSLGASVYELCLGRILGQGDNASEEWHSIRDGVFHSVILENYSPSLVETFKSIMNNDPTVRPSASAVIGHCQSRKLKSGKVAICSPSSYMSPVHQSVADNAIDKYAAMQAELSRLKQENDALRKRADTMK